MKTTNGCAFLIIAALAVFSVTASTTVVFQQGLDGYNGCSDNELRSPEQNYENGPVPEKMEISEL